MRGNEYELPIRFRRETTQLCGHERHGGRCVRNKGHDGPHGCMVWHTGEPITWK